MSLAIAAVCWGPGATLVVPFASAEVIAVRRFVRPELCRQLADELRWALRRGWARPDAV